MVSGLFHDLQVVVRGVGVHGTRMLDGVEVGHGGLPGSKVADSASMEQQKVVEAFCDLGVWLVDAGYHLSSTELSNSVKDQSRKAPVNQ